MKSFKKVLIVGVALTTVSILGACSSDTDVLTKVGVKQPAKAEGDVLKDQKKTPMTTSKRESIKMRMLHHQRSVIFLMTNLKRLRKV